MADDTDSLFPEQFKTCSRCGENKPVVDFHRNKNLHGGRSSACKVCLKAATAVGATMIFVCAKCGGRHTKRNKGSQKYCEECAAEVRRERDRARRPRTIVGFEAECDRCGDVFVRKHSKQIVCPDCVKAVNAERGKRWAADNPGKVLASAKKCNDRRRSTPQGHLEWTMRAAVKRGLFKDTKAGRRTFNLLGYTADELRVWLERLFLPGMSWDNYGEWHIDHRIPLAEFEYQTPDCPDFKRAWALTNLQPLWKLDNLKKGAKRLYLI